MYSSKIWPSSISYQATLDPFIITSWHFSYTLYSTLQCTEIWMETHVRIERTYFSIIGFSISFPFLRMKYVILISYMKTWQKPAYELTQRLWDFYLNLRIDKTHTHKLIIIIHTLEFTQLHINLFQVKHVLLNKKLFKNSFSW